ncbi:MAG: hypothetical protein ACP5UF_06500 [Hydrogenobaculum sp.]
MSLDKFSLYEVNYDKMKLIFANGTDKLWCKDDILKNNSCCRAYRTGADVDSDEFPNVCKCFIKEYNEFQKQEDSLEYYCIRDRFINCVNFTIKHYYYSWTEDFKLFTLLFIVFATIVLMSSESSY